MGRAASLHAKWVRCKPEGAMSRECQELNALYSQCVDGAIIKIPERLRTPPEPQSEFIVDTLLKRAREFAQAWLASEESVETPAHGEGDEQTIQALLSSKRVSMSEFQTIQLAARIARRSWINMRKYFPMMNFSALGAVEKHAVSFLFDMNTSESRVVWNRYLLRLLAP